MDFKHIQQHPDFVEVMGKMQRTLTAHNDKVKLANGLIFTGCVMVVAGAVMDFHEWRWMRHNNDVEEEVEA